MNRRVVFGVLLTLVLIGAAAAIGIAAYNAGVAQGLAESGKLVGPESGGGVPFYGYGRPFFFHRPFGFGCFGLLFPLLFIFLIFALLRGLFWRPHWGWGGGMRHGPWGQGVPPAFEEWHRRAHEPESGQGQQPPSAGG